MLTKSVTPIARQPRARSAAGVFSTSVVRAALRPCGAIYCLLSPLIFGFWGPGKTGVGSIKMGGPSATLGPQMNGRIWQNKRLFLVLRKLVWVSFTQ